MGVLGEGSLPSLEERIGGSKGREAEAGRGSHFSLEPIPRQAEAISSRSGLSDDVCVWSVSLLVVFYEYLSEGLCVHPSEGGFWSVNTHTSKNVES